MVDEAKTPKSKKPLIIGVGVIVLCTIATYAYFKYDELYPSTDDAYVGASLVNVSPKVSGYLTQIAVRNDQVVHKGDLLFTIDPNDYTDNYQGADQNYQSQISQARAAQDQVEIQLHEIQKDQATYNYAKAQYDRYSALYQANTVAKQVYQNVVSEYQNANTQLDIDKKRYIQMKNVADLTDAKTKQSKANLNYAKSNLAATKYYSPVDGYIANLATMTIGELVGSGEHLFGLVDSSNWWVDANFKETQLERLKPGQKVKVVLDMYPSHDFIGEVQSLSYASGSTFSLIPAQNATGNWVKITQRFPVRIKLKDDPKFPLRVGASAKVTVDTWSK